MGFLLAIGTVSGAVWPDPHNAIAVQGIHADTSAEAIAKMCTMVFIMALLYGISPLRPHKFGVNMSVDGVWGSKDGEVVTRGQIPLPYVADRSV